MNENDIIETKPKEEKKSFSYRCGQAIGIIFLSGITISWVLLWLWVIAKLVDWLF